MKALDILGCGLGFGNGPDFSLDRERWAVNKLMFMRYSGEFDRWTRWFDLHSSAHIQRQRPEAYDWYRQQTKPIVRWAHDPNMVTQVYPHVDVQSFFMHEGVPERDFWGSLSWMVALAIYEGFEQMDIYWFPLDQEQHQQQLGSARYWIGQARGRGAIVNIHGDSALKPSGPLYGLETT